ncbi:MAG: hypothetical protein GEU80_14215 [Dehalococcoidia bacterium]|nr:hypothetical protein [Dehalococcoidia bacterium]
MRIPLAIALRSSLGALVTTSMLFALACTGDDGASPTPSPTLEGTRTETPTATASDTPTAEATPSAAPSDEAIEAQLAEVGEVVEAIRGIPSDEKPEWHIVDQDEIRDILAESLEEPDSVRSVQEEQRLYRLLGLIAPGDDLGEIYRALLGDQVLGLYEPDTDRFFVRVDGAFDAAEETTYAHEYVHYLQDLRYDLAAMRQTAGDSRDRNFALTSLVEGDAVRVQLDYTVTHVDRTQLLGMLFTAQAPAVDPPPVVLDLLQFPYLGGATFARSVPDVEAVFESPPLTTEQVIHPEKFAEREAALAVTLPDLASELGGGWTSVDANDFGELFVRAWLEAIGAPASESRPAAAGWGGDAMEVLTHGGDELALGSFIAWDDPTRDIEEFVTALTAALDANEAFPRAGDLRSAQGGGATSWDSPLGVFALARAARGVAIVAAPDREAATALLDGVVGGVTVGP